MISGISGYTPSSWKSNGGYENANGTFIFSLGKESGDEAIQSKPKTSNVIYISFLFKN